MRRVLNRWLLLLLALALLSFAGTGCGKVVLLDGAQCFTDLQEMGERIGCVVFSHQTSTWAIGFRKDAVGKSGDFKFCSSTTFNSCTIDFENIAPRQRLAGETAVIAFPPLSLVRPGGPSSEFLNTCSKLFASTNPTRPSCWNNGIASGIPKEECWYIFLLQYDRDAKSGICSRWSE